MTNVKWSDFTLDNWIKKSSQRVSTLRGGFAATKRDLAVTNGGEYSLTQTRHPPARRSCAQFTPRFLCFSLRPLIGMIKELLVTNQGS